VTRFYSSRAALTRCSRCANNKGGQDFRAAKAKADFTKNNNRGKWSLYNVLNA